MAKVMVLGAGGFGISLALMCNRLVSSGRRSDSAAGRTGAEKTVAGSKNPTGNRIYSDSGAC